MLFGLWNSFNLQFSSIPRDLLLLFILLNLSSLKLKPSLMSIIPLLAVTCSIQFLNKKKHLTIIRESLIAIFSLMPSIITIGLWLDCIQLWGDILIVQLQIRPGRVIILIKSGIENQQFCLKLFLIWEYFF